MPQQPDDVATTAGDGDKDVDATSAGDGAPIDEPTAEAKADTLWPIISALATRFGPVVGEPRTYVSFARMTGTAAFPVPVAIARLAELLNDAGDATVEVGIEDVQFWLQRRTLKAADGLAAIYGIVVDVDKKPLEVISEVEHAGTRLPTSHFETLNGFKLAYASDHPLPLSVFEEIAQRLTLAFDGGDPASWHASQGQRLPKCLKTTEQGVVRVEHVAYMANAAPVTLVPSSIPFPRRVVRELGGWSPSEHERAIIRNHLEALGIAVPTTPGTSLGATCPERREHDSRCCYVNVRDDGSIHITCLAGHDGRGQLHWSEQALFKLAGGEAGIDDVALDPLNDLPVTWASRKFVKYRLREWPSDQRDAAVDVWMRERARCEARNKDAEDLLLSVYRDRIHGDRQFGAVEVYFAHLDHDLAYDDRAGRQNFLNCTKAGPTAKANLHECLSTAAWTVVEGEDDDGPAWLKGWLPETSSLMNKIIAGHRAALRVTGVPVLTRYDLPIAHVSESWDLEPRTNVITGVVPFKFPEGVIGVDALEFFLRLFRNRRLPVASENDAKLLVACIASPLLRHIGVGQLGIYWFVGPPGEGKDYLAEMAAGIWEVINPHRTRCKFDLNLTDDLEIKRSFAMAKGAVYARAKEAGKRIGMVEQLIRLSGTDMVSARDLWKGEFNLPNAFTYVADSAEDIPDRKEISRRTVVITVSDTAPSVSKGVVLDEVRAAAPGLLLNLKQLVESQSAESYRHQANTGTRPLIPVALARLLGATLPEVTGQDLTDIFEAMRDFVKTPAAKEEGERERKKALERPNKESIEAKTLPHYRLSFFIDQTKDQAGNRDLFSPYGNKAEQLKNRIVRESGYAEVRSEKVPFLTVLLGATEYAFKLERANRNFILMPKSEFESRMKAVSNAQHAAEAAPSTQVATTMQPVPSTQAAGDTIPSDSTEPAAQDEPATSFTTDELLGASGQSS